MEVPRQRWHDGPRHLSLALTNACELQCPYCYAPKRPGSLDADRVVAWAVEVAQEGCLGVGFGGGEPTAYRRLPEVCHRITGSTDMAVTITTHGHRFDEALSSALRDAVHFIRVSVDGVGDTYERLRGRTFDALRRRLERVSTVSPFGINVVVNDDTVSALDALAAFACEQGATEMLLLPEQATDGRPGISHSALETMESWLDGGSPPLRVAISRLGLTDVVPIADAFPGERPLEGLAHLDAFGFLGSDAFTGTRVAVGESIMSAVRTLSRRLGDENLAGPRL